MQLDQTTNANNMAWQQGQYYQYRQQAFTLLSFEPQQQPQFLQQQPLLMLKVRRSDCKCVVCRVEYDDGK